MKRIIPTLLVAISIAALSATAVFAGQPAGATGHGAEVSAVARAVDYVSGQAKGAAISAIAKTHGAQVSAAAKANGAAHAAAGKANGAAASEPGRLKAAAGGANRP